MGKLGWPPSEFWGAGLGEALAALDGFGEFHGAKPPAGPPPAKVDAMLLKYPDPPRGRRG